MYDTLVKWKMNHIKLVTATSFHILRNLNWTKDPFRGKVKVKQKW